jgi:hypothetical protein
MDWSATPNKRTESNRTKHITCFISLISFSWEDIGKDAGRQSYVITPDDFQSDFHEIPLLLFARFDY